ncbi:aminotransferase class III-fold pyridoxal phosphate-dependent enzyme [Nocardia carnea]|uniref:aminotransferase class III-fold pyridoxal phosphate-dependent enzyme n=1 Tax=Nocardia carnea TaxID=37328 RepID=UPI00245621BC|nr:aminotransferase class III-fold pyridoxal phosphate-dependent enzyme [Nocardia carnea]
MAALHPHHPPIVHASGAHFTCSDGRRFTDLAAQTLNLALGHCHPRVAEAVATQAKQVVFASSRFGTLPFVLLSQRIAELAPAGLDAVALKLADGSDAVETAVKLAMLHTRRRHIACLPGAWHGETHLTLGMASSHCGRLVSNASTAVFAPESSIPALTRLVRSRRDLAAAVLDPAMVSNGLPGEDTTTALAELRAACTETGTLLIFDEIQTFGWLGRHLFTTEATGVYPDAVCLGKAFSSGYPLAAVLARRDLAAVLQYNDGEFTYGGHPVSCAAALAGLEVLCEQREELGAREDAFTAMLAAAFDDRFEVRRHGLIATVTTRTDRLREAWAAGTVAACAEAGLLVRPNDHGRRLLIKAPLVMPERELRDSLDTLAHIGARVIGDIAVVQPAGSAHAGLPCRSGTVLRKPLQPNPHEDYVAALLRAAPVHLHIASRDALTQQRLTRHLREIGVPAAAAYATDDGSAVDYGYVTGRSLREVLADPSSDAATINGLALRHHELVCRAHDHGIVLGDRWPGNAIATGNDLILIDFDLGYEGPAHELMLFEEVFAVLQTLVAIPSAFIGRDDLGARLTDAIVARHGCERVEGEFTRLAAWYLDPARPVHAGSDSTDSYKAVVGPALARLTTTLS